MLTLNSALNPLNVQAEPLSGVVEERKMEMRTRMMIGKLHTKIPKWQPASVQELMSNCIRSMVIEKQTVMSWLGSNVDSTPAVSHNDDLFCNRDDVHG